MSDVSLRDVMRTFPQGVVVVTAEGDEGPRGITVSSFTSVSLTPPLVLICVMKEARAHAAIAKGKFTINVLSDTQGALSDHFASPNLSSSEQFESHTYPKLADCLATCTASSSRRYRKAITRSSSARSKRRSSGWRGHR